MLLKEFSTCEERDLTSLVFLITKKMTNPTKIKLKKVANVERKQKHG